MEAGGHGSGDVSMGAGSSSDANVEPERPFEFYNMLTEGPLNLLKKIRGFIISMPKKDVNGNPVRCKLEGSEFVQKCRDAGAPLKVLENVCAPCVK